MRIDRVDIYHVALPLHRPIPVHTVPYSEGTPPLERVESVLVAMHSGDDIGWGEAAPGNLPLLSHEWAGSVFLALRDFLAPALVGRDIDSGENLHKQFEFLKGNRYAKAALDLAWWDLRAKRQSKPLYELLGAKATAVPVGETFDQVESVDDFLKSLHEAVERGSSRLGLKIRPGWDASMLNIVRQDFPTLSIHGDFEGALRLDHMELLCRLDDFHLTFLEQPLPADDYVGHAMVQETIATPLCLDESVTTPEQADIALELHSGKYLNVNPQRVGGLTHALAIHDAAHDKCTPCYVGIDRQTAIGVRAALALAGKFNFTYPADYFDSQSLLVDDLAPPLETANDEETGALLVRLSDAPGIGAEPDSQTLSRYRLQEATVD